jgi:hypothetical protein
MSREMITKFLSLLPEIFRHLTTAARSQSHFQKRSEWQSEFLFVPEKRFYAPVSSHDFMRG